MLVIKNLEKFYKGTAKGISGVSLHIEKRRRLCLHRT